MDSEKYAALMELRDSLTAVVEELQGIRQALQLIAQFIQGKESEDV